MSDDSAPSFRREIAAIVVVVLVAIAIRTIYLLQYRAGIPYFYRVTLDSAYYDAWAQRVAEGKGYGPMPFYMAPLYPYVLALIYKLAGHQYIAVYLLQALLGTANTALVYVIGRKLLGQRAGLIAAGLVLLYAPLMYLESKLLTEVLAVTLNLVAVLLLMRAVERPSTARFLVTGLVFGVSAVCRPAALIMVALLIPWLWLRNRDENWRRQVRMISPLILGVLLAIIPVTTRNYFIGRDFAVLSTNAGIVFAQGNGEYATGISTPLPGFSGTILTQQREEMAQASSALGKPVKPSESSAYWFKRALGFIREHPVDYLTLLGRKVIWTLHNRESPCSYNIYYEREYVPVLRWLALPFPLLAGFALFGWTRSRGGTTGILGLYVLSILLSLMLFSVSSRYRAPVVPALAVFAACGVLGAADGLRKANPASAVLALGCVALMFTPSLVRFPTPAVTAEAPTNMGWSFMEQGKVEPAIVQFRKALEMNPHFSHAHNNLGIALARQGKVDEAITEYEVALSLTPDYPEAHFNLGDALVRKGRFDEAIDHYRSSLDLRPDRAETHVHLGNALLGRGRIDEAIGEYREAISLDPEVPDAKHNLKIALGAKERSGGSGRMSKQDQAIEHYNRANGLLREGRFEDAAAEYRRAITLDPGSGRAHNNLAVVLFFMERYADAWEEIRLARKYGAEPSPGFLRDLSERMPEP